MALKAGYRGIKKYIADKLNRMNPGDSFATDAEIAAAAQAQKQLLEDTVGWNSGNQLGFPYYTSSVSGDISITSKEDGSIIVGSGTATQREVFYIKIASDNFHPPKGKYKISKGFINSVIGIVIDATNVNTWVKSLARSFGSDDNEFDIDYDGYDRISIYLACEVGAVSTGFTFTPKLTHISVDEQKADISALGTQEDETASKLYHVGEHFYKDGQSCEVIGNTDVAQGATWTLNTNYKVKSVYESLIKRTSFSISVDDKGQGVIYTSNDRYIFAAICLNSNNKVLSIYKRTANPGYGIYAFDPFAQTPVVSTTISGEYLYIEG